MPFSLLHVIHIVLMSTPPKVMRTTTSSIITAMKNLSSSLFFPCIRFQDVGIGWTAFPINSKVRSVVFGVDLSFPFPTVIITSHGYVFEDIMWFVRPSHPASILLQRTYQMLPARITINELNCPILNKDEERIACNSNGWLSSNTIFSISMRDE